MKINILNINSLFENSQILSGGRGDKKSEKDFDPREFKIGIAVEKEHTPNINIVKEIVCDHLSDNSHYYSELCSRNMADEHEAMILYRKFFTKS